MEIEPARDHGHLVWAKLKSTSSVWAGMIICVEKLDLTFKEKSGKSWIFWLAEHRLSHVENKYIYDLITDYEKYTKNLTENRKKGVIVAIEILAHQFKIEIPHDLLWNQEGIPWAGQNVVKNIQNQMGKLKRNDEYYIPQNIIKIITTRNSKNISQELHTSMKTSINKRSLEPNNTSDNKKKCWKDCCIGCRNLIVGKKAEHPLFYGDLCETCHKLVKSDILTVFKDNYMNVCCVCFVKDNYRAVVCGCCVCMFCVKCVSHFCGKSSFKKIVNIKGWNCFACCSNNTIPSDLNRRSTDEQLNNIYKLYTPATNGIEAKLHSIPKINVVAMKDKHNLMFSILNELNYPFNLIDELIFQTNNNNVELVNLIIRYSHITDQEKLDKTDAHLEFLNYYYMKMEMETISHAKGTPFFWAYECSSAIPSRERKIITRYFKLEPTLISQGVRNVRDRGRLIWTNIFLHEDDVRLAQKHNMLVQKFNPSALEKDTALSYNSMHLILSSFIRNHIQKE